jgi:hypothetical protein
MENNEGNDKGVILITPSEETENKDKQEHC